MKLVHSSTNQKPKQSAPRRGVVVRPGPFGYFHDWAVINLAGCTSPDPWVLRKAKLPQRRAVHEKDIISATTRADNIEGAADALAELLFQDLLRYPLT